MDKHKLVHRLLPLVADIKWERLEDYLSYERAILVEQLIASTDIKRINRLQGEIAMMDKLIALPATVKRSNP